jgi:hypothetical protein
MTTIAELTNHPSARNRPARVTKESLRGLALNPTNHALKTIMDKGLNPDDVLAAFRNPARVYPSGSHPGQIRVTGFGLCLVGKIEGDLFSLITVYLDEVLTPPRADQLHTIEGRRYASRHSAGLGRG